MVDIVPYIWNYLTFSPHTKSITDKHTQIEREIESILSFALIPCYGNRPVFLQSHLSADRQHVKTCLWMYVIR